MRTTTFEDDAGTYTLSLEYQFNASTLTYLAHGTAIVPGGLQLRSNAESEPATFEPEFVDDIELGLKSTFDLGDALMQLDLAIYEQNYEDIQRTLSFIPAPGQPLATLVLNAGKATIRGGEFQGTLLPMDRLELSAFVGYTDASYDEFNNPGIAAASFPIPGRPLKDNDFAMVPKMTSSATARYTLPLEPSWARSRCRRTGIASPRCR